MRNVRSELRLAPFILSTFLVSCRAALRRARIPVCEHDKDRQADMSNSIQDVHDDGRVYIFDTTLRDGEQSPGASMNREEKIAGRTRADARLNVDIIEAGFPIASPGDFDAVKAIAEELDGPIVAGLARSLEKDIKAAGNAVKNAKRPRIHVFLATSAIHREFKLKKAKDEIVRQAVDSVKLARTFCADVEFSPEDASRTEPEFLCEVCEAVIAAGATTVNIPDTVGYAVPEQYGALIHTLKTKVPNIAQAVISVHCHDDLGLAVSNSLAGVKNGARQVECTINGIGERAGKRGTPKKSSWPCARARIFTKVSTPTSTRRKSSQHRVWSRCSPVSTCSATRPSWARTPSRTNRESIRTVC